MSRFIFVLGAVSSLSLAMLFLPSYAQPQGQEKPVKPIITFKSNEESQVMAMLNTSIETKPLHNKVKMKEALEFFSEIFGGKLVILIDRESFAIELGADAPDPYEEEVSLPESPAKMPVSQALRLILTQIGKGHATYVIRRHYLDITTKRSTMAPMLLRRSITFRNFDQKPLPEILGALAEENSLAINLDPAVGNKGLMPISATFRNSSVEDALVTVTEMAELKFVVLENSVFVTTPDKAIILRQEEERRAEDRKELKATSRLEPAP
jgi:hypothetical protein